MSDLLKMAFIGSCLTILISCSNHKTGGTNNPVNPVQPQTNEKQAFPALEPGNVKLTDKDFGELVFRRGAKASHGIILFRISQPSSAAIAERVAAVLASRDDWAGHFSVVDDLTVRIRRLPQN